MDTSSVEKSLVSGSLIYVGQQILSKGVSFVLNQYLVRISNPTLFGDVASYEALCMMVLFFSRYAVRLAAQRQPCTAEGRSNVATLGSASVLFGSAMLLFVSFWWRHSHTALVYDIATFIELCTEPFYCMAMFDSKDLVIARAEFYSLIIKSLVSVYFVKQSASPLSFAYGQTAYAVSLLALYVVSTKSIPSLTRLAKDNYILLLTLFGQSLFHYYQSEGDRLLVMSLPAEDRGVYYVASNYGSLIARLLFLPVEEKIRQVFSRARQSNRASDILSLAQDVLRWYAYFAGLILLYAPLLLPFLFSFVAGSSWLGIDRILHAYGYYVSFLALNGVLEAMLQATLPVQGLRRQTIVSFIFSILHYLLGTRMLQYGAKGLIFANIANMALRIVFAAILLSRSLNVGPTSIDWRLSPLFVVTYAILPSSISNFYDLTKIVATGLTLTAAVAVVELRKLRKVRRQQTTKKEH
ncbi:hypothetical protein CANCADRAFT_1239 [Tortispora caseinolytica NRRL Y-17796]|uniref:Man(5)GlcNAc(2)-PP-dolichol translocation protein RFT1 n=1 Tax=Tortispora caseinolytica NRRL Y-17796 TaxID=767744 RepID=A0A1E4TLX8_9ASCO|nr:hypothetical protein CANCADRAFT_1239 [Tortispora caseinolytica NRRL Y-17796]